MPSISPQNPNPIDRNADSPQRQRRNWQRAASGALTGTIKVSPPLTNTGGKLGVSVDGVTIIINGSGQLQAIVSAIATIVYIVGEIPSGTLDGSNKAFSLNQAPLGNLLDVYRDGILMRINDDYTLSGSLITFATAPASVSSLRVDYQWLALGGIGATDGEPLTGTIDGVNTIFTVMHTPVGSTAVYRDGLRMLAGTDYTISGNTITFSVAPTLNSLLTAAYQWTVPAAGIIVEGEIPSGTVNGSNVTFTLAHTPINSSLALYRDGVRLSAPGDYTISSATITFVTAPTVGSVLQADYQH